MGVCPLGSTRMCAGSACIGTTTCQGSPADWGPCICSDVGPSSDAGNVSSLGASCKRTGDCPKGGSCLLAPTDSFFGGAPSEGVCVATCQAAGDCSPFSNAVCVDVSDSQGASASNMTGLCMEQCLIGESSTQKCHGGAHVACTSLTDQGSTGYCRPVCASDAECSSGACDPQRGVCVTRRVTDTTFGQVCDTMSSGVGAGGADNAAGGEGGTFEAGAAGAASDETAAACAGQCLKLNGASSVCSRRCVFGNTDECAPATGGLRRGACVFVTPGGTIGDLGYCAELCDCNQDCVEQTFTCEAFDDASLESAFGRKGTCVPPDYAGKHSLVCGS